MGNEGSTEAQLKKLLSDVNSMQGKLHGLTRQAEELKGKRNIELGKELVPALYDLADALARGPIEKYHRVQEILLEMSKNDERYWDKIASSKNPYGLKFKDDEEMKFIHNLLGNCLKLSTNFCKFLAYIAAKGGHSNFFIKDIKYE